ncbi:hypothetical protein HanRHA438_Chr11g0508421 [Helianthus annuus]|uniref:Uncharacterized protein n=1 Tax=Helianthus annuus TaxID=4232 RepID=A0A9K3N0D1_HELAN|nr:hypothetical protein HanXRQr2_Chr11g0495821 [Helianthus annuus]KAJ0871109.1 hypothetical protein HanRHA438_Chr11g0508421 [Helianthus annuus]KAJ0875559.1 hypothetical protein HanPSC8_Chr11g0477831 [Helianthus annuus]
MILTWIFWKSQYIIYVHLRKKKHIPLLPLLFLLRDEENPNFKTLVTSFTFCFPLS